MKVREALAHVERLAQRPGLVGVDHQRRVGAQQVAQGLQVAQITFRAKADLELESRITLVALGSGEDFRIRRVQPGSISLYFRGSAQQSPQRLPLSLAQEIPKRDVGACDCLCDGPGLRSLDGEHVQTARKLREGLFRIGPCLAEQDGCDAGFQDARTMLCPDSGEIAPDLAPADRALMILDAHQYGRTIPHYAK